MTTTATTFSRITEFFTRNEADTDQRKRHDWGPRNRRVPIRATPSGGHWAMCKSCRRQVVALPEVEVGHGKGKTTVPAKVAGSAVDVGCVERS
jgi:hypothetical protein